MIDSLWTAPAMLGCLILGMLLGGFLVWTAAKARWLEREAQIEQERDDAARRQWWHDEAIRRGVLYDSVMESSASPLTPAGEIRAEKLRRWRELEPAASTPSKEAPLRIPRTARA